MEQVTKNPGNPSVIPSADFKAPPIEIMLANLKAAMAEYSHHHKSLHWDRFPEDYTGIVANTKLWSEFRRNGLSAAFDSSPLSTEIPLARITDPSIVARYRETYDDLCRLIGVDFVRRFSENEIGAPEYIEVEGLKVTITDLRLIYNAWRIKERLGERYEEQLVIADIGGGYGGLAVKLKRLFPNAKILLFDLPEVNAVQTYYLSQACSENLVAGFKDLQQRDIKALFAEDWSFLTLPGWTISKLPPNSLDLVINTRSMMEMYRSTIQEYFDAIHRSLKHGGMFYCVNRYTNKASGERIRIKEYPFDYRWRPVVSAPCWNQPWIHELMVQRVDGPNDGQLARLLRDLPPVTLKDVGRGFQGSGHRLATLIFGDHPSINPGLRWFLRNWLHRAERFLVQKVKANKKLHRALRHLLGRSRGGRG